MISYSGLTNNSKMILPAIESWGTNTHIKRDPPKSIMTRRKDKVGDDNSITRAIDDSGDRFCESINVYGRGVNPFVGVNYNNGMVGGASGNSSIKNKQQSKLIHPVMKDGDFRPPVKTEFDLRPLSRLPRLNVSALTNKDFPNFKKKLLSYTGNEDMRQVKNDILKTTAETSKSTKLKFNNENKLVVQSIENYTINKTKANDIGTGKQFIAHTKLDVKKPSKNIKKYDTNFYDRTTNKLDLRKYKNNTNNKKTDKYLQKTLHSDMTLNKLDKSKNVSNQRENSEFTNFKINELKNIEYDAPITKNKKIEYNHKDIVLDKKLMPDQDINTNKNNSKKFVNNNSNVVRNKTFDDKIQVDYDASIMNDIMSSQRPKVNDINNRDVVLNKMASYGSTMNVGTKSSFGKDNNYKINNNNKRDLINNSRKYR